MGELLSRYITMLAKCLPALLILAAGVSGKISHKNDRDLIEGPNSLDFLSALHETGVFVFTGLSEEYQLAVKRLRKISPQCLKDYLAIELEDGSTRYTVARDSNSNKKFPSCVSKEVNSISKTFDAVDKFVIKALTTEFNSSIFISTKTKNYHLDDLPEKSHLHVYKKNLNNSNDIKSLSFPFHTDNGLYLLLTPSEVLPIKTVNREGTVSNLQVKDDRIIFMAGTGLTSWLLPDEGLFPVPHAVPRISQASRTVFARMKVAPLSAMNINSDQTFGQHFYSGVLGSDSELNPTERRHLERMRRQAGVNHEQHWIGQTSPIPNNETTIDSN